MISPKEPPRLSIVIEYPCTARQNAQLKFDLEALQIVQDRVIADTLEAEPSPTVGTVPGLQEHGIAELRALDKSTKTSIAELRRIHLDVRPTITNYPTSWLQFKLIEWVLLSNYPEVALRLPPNLQACFWPLGYTIPGTDKTVRELLRELPSIPRISSKGPTEWVIIQNQIMRGCLECEKKRCRGLFHPGELMFVNPMTLRVRCLQCGPSISNFAQTDIVYDPYRSLQPATSDSDAMEVKPLEPEVERTGSPQEDDRSAKAERSGLELLAELRLAIKSRKDAAIAMLKEQTLVIGPAVTANHLHWLRFKLLEYVVCTDYAEWTPQRFIHNLPKMEWLLTDKIPFLDKTVGQLMERLTSFPRGSIDAEGPEITKWVMIQNQIEPGRTKCQKGDCSESPDATFKLGEVVFINPMNLELRCLYCGPVLDRDIVVVYDPYRDPRATVSKPSEFMDRNPRLIPNLREERNPTLTHDFNGRFVERSRQNARNLHSSKIWEFKSTRAVEYKLPPQVVRYNSLEPRLKSREHEFISPVGSDKWLEPGKRVSPEPWTESLDIEDHDLIKSKPLTWVGGSIMTSKMFSKFEASRDVEADMPPLTTPSPLSPQERGKFGAFFAEPLPTALSFNPPSGGGRQQEPPAGVDLNNAIADEHKKLIQLVKKIDAKLNPAPTEPPVEAVVESDKTSSKPEPPEDSLCVICMDSPRTWVIMPCGHRHFCEDCAKKLKDCATCRGRIAYRGRVFE